MPQPGERNAGGVVGVQSMRRVSIYVWMLYYVCPQEKYDLH